MASSTTAPPPAAPPATASLSLTIAEAAEATGLTAHTLRYYERNGLLLQAVERAPSGHRRYTDDDVRWIWMVTRLRSTGMPIREVRAYTRLVQAGPGNEGARLELLERHRASVLAELEQIRAHLEGIDVKIVLYKGALASSR
jgi:DNA-binding transcriptional MerR regulator